MQHYQVCDARGHQALLSMVDCIWPIQRLQKYASAVRIYETGEVLKPLPHGQSWEYNPQRVSPIRGTVKWAPFGRIAAPMVFTLGYETDAGFSLPDRATLNKLYDRVWSTEEKADEFHAPSLA